MLNGYMDEVVTEFVNSPTALSSGIFSIPLPAGRRILFGRIFQTLAAALNLNANYSWIDLRIKNSQRSQLPFTDYGPLCTFLGGVNRDLGIRGDAPGGDGPGGGRTSIPIFFMDPSAKSIVGAERGSLDVPEGAQWFIDLKQAGATMTTAPANIRAKFQTRLLSDVPQSDLNFVRDSAGNIIIPNGGLPTPILHRWIKNTLTASGTQQTLENRDDFKQGIIDSMHFKDPTGAVINRIRFTADGRDVFDLYRDELNDLLIDSGYVPRTGFFDIVPSALTEINSDAWRMDGKKEPKFYLEYATAPDGPGATAATASGNVEYIIRRWGPPQ